MGGSPVLVLKGHTWWHLVTKTDSLEELKAVNWMQAVVNVER